VDEWKFYEDMNGKWSWQNTSPDSAGQSLERFATFVDAMANAVQHGLEPGESKISAVKATARAKAR
jgi:hypothetical protein